jgi:hypothetical protein
VYLLTTPFIFFGIKQKNINMKKFIQNNFTVIVLVIALLGFFKGCGDSRDLSKIKKEIQAIKDSTYTKDQLQRQLRISGLESEKRMIQATDRKLLDVRRQTEIEDEIKRLNSIK